MTSVQSSFYGLLVSKSLYFRLDNHPFSQSNPSSLDSSSNTPFSKLKRQIISKATFVEALINRFKHNCMIIIISAGWLCNHNQLPPIYDRLNCLELIVPASRVQFFRRTWSCQTSDLEIMDFSTFN